MFSPYDESNHAGLLTGMSRHAIGLAGPVNTKKHAQNVKTARALRSTSAEDVAAYMKGAYNPPTDTTSPEERALFAKARLEVEKNPAILKLRAFLRSVESTYQVYIDAAKKEAQTAQATIDNYEKDVKAAEDALDAVMQPLVEEAAKLDQEFLNFIDWIQSSVKEIAEFGSGADDNYADKLWSSGALDMSHGQDALFACAQALYHEWEKAPYAGSGPPLQLLPAANPPLIYKGKAVTGVEPVVVWNKVTQQNEVRPDIGYMYVKWIAFSVQDKGYSIQQKWQFSGDVTKAPTRLRSLGPTAKASGVPGGYMAANRWNNGVYPRVVKMAALWNLVQPATSALSKVKNDYVAAQKALSQAQQTLLEVQSPTKQVEAILKQAPQGFVRGYAEALVKARDLLSKATAGFDRTATYKVTVPKFDSILLAMKNALVTVQKAYAQGLTTDDAGQKAAILSSALALVNATQAQVNAAKADTSAYEEVLKNRLETVRQIEALGIGPDPAAKQFDPLVAVAKLKKALLDDSKKIQEIRDGSAALSDAVAKVQEQVKAKTEEAIANVGVKETAKEETKTETTTTSTKSSPALPIALGIIGIAAALRG